MRLTNLFSQRKVKDIMTRDPQLCTPNDRLQEAACLMVDFDCGEIPVVEHDTDRRPIGVITDRDIVCRAVAAGRNPLDLRVGDCMTSPCFSVSEEATLDECCVIMEERQIRRVPVVNALGQCCGIVSQADIAAHTAEVKTGEVVREVSRPLASQRMVA
jgi:CBS domain-containing protein